MYKIFGYRCSTIILHNCSIKEVKNRKKYYWFHGYFPSLLLIFLIYLYYIIISISEFSIFLLNAKQETCIPLQGWSIPKKKQNRKHDNSCILDVRLNFSESSIKSKTVPPRIFPNSFRSSRRKWIVSRIRSARTRMHLWSIHWHARRPETGARKRAKGEWTRITMKRK